MEEEIKRLKRELFELKNMYNELLKKYTRVSNELLLYQEVYGIKFRNSKK